jgi:hypothetical protein
MVYYWASAVGICLILKYGTILNSFREKTSLMFPVLTKLYKCCLCMGFWVGLSMIPFLYFLENNDIKCILFPFSVSFWGFLFDSIITIIHTVNNYFVSSSEKSLDNK